MPVFSNQDLTIDQGADLAFTTAPWVVNGIIQNLTGDSCRLYIFKNPYDQAPFAILTSTPTVFGSAIPNGAAGTATATFAKFLTSTLPGNIGPLTYVWYVDTPGNPGTSTVLQSGRLLVNSALFFPPVPPVAGGVTITVASSPYSPALPASGNLQVFVDVTGGPVTINLPVGTQNVTVTNIAGPALTNNITVNAPAGSTIASPASPQTFGASAVINITGSSFTWSAAGTKLAIT